MWIVMTGSILVTIVLTLLVFTLMQKRERKRAIYKEEKALKGIGIGIGERLHATLPGSKWRWVCRPAGFALNGGTARIEVINPSGNMRFMDVCLFNGYMAIHVANVTELTASGAGSTVDFETSANKGKLPLPIAPSIGIIPHDEDSLTKWYNIVFIDPLTTLIGDLHAREEFCLNIGIDGKAYVEDGDGISVVYDFGEMPGVALWSHITEKLGAAGLFAEVRENNCIFISWA